MSRKSFDDGHQNAGHASGGTVDFNEMHQLFHGGMGGAESLIRGMIDDAQVAETGRTQDEVGGVGHRDVISDVARDEGISFDEAATFVPGANQELYQHDLGDLVDPQDDTYEEEGTHGLPLIAKAAAKGYMAARSNPKTGPLVKAGEQVVKEKSKELVGQAIAKGKEKWGARSEGELKGKGGAGLASPASESDDPLA
jgi:hypothetical protein